LHYKERVASSSLLSEVLLAVLFGRSFLIRTNHAALSWLRKTPEPIGQNARWLEQLEEYTFEVQHLFGVLVNGTGMQIQFPGIHA